MNPLFVSAATSILIWLLTFGSGWLVEHGVWSSGDAKTYTAAAAMGLLSFAWAQRVWVKDRLRLLVALMPGIHTEDAVNAHLADKTLPNPTLLTPPNTPPGVPLPPTTPPPTTGGQ